MRRLLRAAVLLSATLALAAGLAAAVRQDAIEIVASRSGFEPPLLELRKGDSVTLRLSTRDEEHCFAIDAFRVEKRIQPGRATTAEFTVDKAGEFPFYCCLEPANEALRGRLIVRE
jgi:heme/copper-type cytochrome/quinol oxidase subunit 2